MTVPTRIVPPFGFGLRAGRPLERNLMVYRRQWLIIFSGFFEPLFYLLGIGFGIGALVGGVTSPSGEPVPYAAFVAPGLLAASAMNGAIYDATFNVFFKLRYAKTYDAMLATPLGIDDVALGEISWALSRGTLYAIGFFAVMILLGLIWSPWFILALPAAMVIAFAFAAVGMAATTFMRAWTDFDYIFVATLPMFLFSATFYPITVYPPLLQAFVAITPLYHGVHLLRSLSLGAISADLLVDVAYLVTMGLIGLTIAVRRLDRLLQK